jgi:hypothetical protein
MPVIDQISRAIQASIAESLLLLARGPRWARPRPRSWPRWGTAAR